MDIFLCFKLKEKCVKGSERKLFRFLRLKGLTKCDVLENTFDGLVETHMFFFFLA